VAGLQSMLGSTLTNAKTFASQIKKLQKEGASQDLITQILGMGPSAGSALATQLLAAGAGTVKQISATMASIAAVTQKESQQISAGFYSQGADALANYIAGIEKKYPELVKALDPIRKELSSVFGTTAPKIKIPSTTSGESLSAADFKKQWESDTKQMDNLIKELQDHKKMSKEKLEALEKTTATKLEKLEAALIKAAGSNHADLAEVEKAISEVGKDFAKAATVQTRKTTK
jgi:hypothetical protein